MKATEKKLSRLHDLVADVLTEQVGYKEKVTTFNEDGEMVEGEERYIASPATVAAATKFLRDNNITSDEELNENMNGLRDALAAKQKHSRTSLKDVDALQ